MSITIESTEMPDLIKVNGKAIEIVDDNPVDVVMLSDSELRAVKQFVASRKRLRIQSMVVDG